MYIYYMWADNMDLQAPVLQISCMKGVEVLILSDPSDEPGLLELAGYEGKQFVSIHAEGANFAQSLRFCSTASIAAGTSFEQYVGRMQAGQACIYYTSGHNFMEQLDLVGWLLPACTEARYACKFEVLHLPDMDELCLQQLVEYEGKKFVSIREVKEASLENGGKPATSVATGTSAMSAGKPATSVAPETVITEAKLQQEGERGAGKRCARGRRRAR